MIANKKYLNHSLVILTIVLTAFLTGCGGGGESKTATDGTTIAASAPNINNIYIATSAATNKQATMSFSVTKSGAPVANTGVTVTLNSQALSAGVTFFGGATTLSLTTNALGVTPTFAVVAGNIPTSVIVKGTLSSYTSVTDYSTSITISSGSPVQDRFTLAIELGKSVIESWSYLLDTVGITASVADRLGNPVPDGTPINFTASAGGTVTSSCTTVNSQCTVTLTISGTKTSPYITILAYSTGEESFIDNNGNNKYDLGESFTDLGNVYRDDDRNSSYTSGEQIIVTTGAGTGICPTNSLGFPYTNLLSVPLTCDGVWSNNILIRSETFIYLAESNFNVSITSRTPSAVTFEVSGAVNGGRAPNGTSVAVAFPTLPTGSTCSAGSVTGSPISTGYTATTHTVVLTPGCAGQTMQITVTTPKANTRIYNLAV